MPTDWWVDLGPGTNKLEVHFQNGTCQLHCPCGRMSPQNVYCRCLCPQDESQLSSSSLGGSPRSARESDSSFFQITASALSPGVYEILCAPFNSGISISHRPDSPENKPHWPSKPKILGSRLPSAEPRGWGAQWGACTPCSLGRTSTIVITLPLVSHLPWGFFKIDILISLTIKSFICHLLLYFMTFIYWFLYWSRSYFSLSSFVYFDWRLDFVNSVF